MKQRKQINARLAQDICFLLFSFLIFGQHFNDSHLKK